MSVQKQLSRSGMSDKQKTSNLREQIDANLKRVYGELVNEEVPDRLKALIEQLQKQENTK